MKICSMEPKIEKFPKKLSHIPPLVFIETLAHQVFADDPGAARQFAADLLSGKAENEEFFMQAKVAGRERQFLVEIVKVLEAKRFSVPEGAPTEVVLTSRLNGCIATLIVADGKGGREAALSHFPPFMLDRNVKNLDQVVTPDMRMAEKKTIFMLVAANRKEEIPRLREEVVKLVGADASVTVQEYTTDPTKPDSGVLLVKIPPAGEGSVSVHTWEKSQKP